jgi:hypothetical protein
MTLHPDEFGGIQQRLLESAITAAEAQFAEAEKIASRWFPTVEGDAKARLLIAVVQAIATNYLAAATVRNLPKG